MNSDKLQDLAWMFEDEGRSVYVQRDAYTGVIEYIDVDGEEYLNDNYDDEVADAYWLKDSYRAAGHAWRE